MMLIRIKASFANAKLGSERSERNEPSGRAIAGVHDDAY